jgi:uncharacterized membrane protein YqjE
VFKIVVHHSSVLCLELAAKLSRPNSATLGNTGRVGLVCVVAWLLFRGWRLFAALFVMVVRFVILVLACVPCCNGWMMCCSRRTVGF